MNPSVQRKPISIVTNKTANTNGQIVVDKQSANPVKVLDGFSSEIYYTSVAKSVGRKEQSAVIGSFAEQSASWSKRRAECILE
jgi:hypothetical protein